MHSRSRHAPRILLVASLHWSSTTRLAMALVRSGFEVSAIAPPEHAIRHLPGVTAFYPCDPYRSPSAAIQQVTLKWWPDMIVPADDRAVEWLHELHTISIRTRRAIGRYIADLVVKSIGDPLWFATSNHMSALIGMAALESLPTPRGGVVNTIAELRHDLENMTLPVVLKLDGSAGGLGVRIVRSRDEAEAAFLALRSMSGVWAAVKHSVKRLTFGPVLLRLQRPRPAILLQEFVPGTPANRAVICVAGRVLGGTNVLAERTMSETRPATVVRVIENAEMDEIAEHLVKRQRLSGFIGFDFILDEVTQRVVLLEMNARPTQICHFPEEVATDLCALLFAEIANKTRRVPKRKRRFGSIPLFPQELWRDPESSLFRRQPIDIPFGTPEILQAYKFPVASEAPAWTDNLKARFRRLAASAGIARSAGGTPGAAWVRGGGLIEEMDSLTASLWRTAETGAQPSGDI